MSSIGTNSLIRSASSVLCFSICRQHHQFSDLVCGAAKPFGSMMTASLENLLGGVAGTWLDQKSDSAKPARAERAGKSLNVTKWLGPRHKIVLDEPHEAKGSNVQIGRMEGQWRCSRTAKIPLDFRFRRSQIGPNVDLDG